MYGYTSNSSYDITEAYRSVYENPNIRIDPNDEIQNSLAQEIENCSKSYHDILKYAEMLFKWLKNDQKNSKHDSEVTPYFIKNVYVNNFGNLVDCIKEYEQCVKTLRKSGKTNLSMEVYANMNDQNPRHIPFDALYSTSFRDNGMNLMRFVNKRAERTEKENTVKNFSKEDLTNIFLSNYSNRFVVFTTRTFESTNKFIYAIWKNTNMNVDYGNPTENSPYCTRQRMHWDSYSKGNPSYCQYWFFYVPENCIINRTGSIADKDIMNVLAMISDNDSDGKHGLICMNDTYGDILDYNDEKMTPSERLQNIINRTNEYDKKMQYYKTIGTEAREAKKQWKQITDIHGYLIGRLLDIYKENKENVHNIMKDIIPSNADDEYVYGRFVYNCIDFMIGENYYARNVPKDYIENAYEHIRTILKLGGNGDDDIEKMNYIIENCDSIKNNKSDLISKSNALLSDLNKTYHEVCDKTAASLKDSTEIFNYFEIGGEHIEESTNTYMNDFIVTDDSIKLVEDGKTIGYINYSIDSVDDIIDDMSSLNALFDYDALRRRLMDEPTAYIELLMVEKEYRHQGNAKKLMEKFIDEMHDNGIFQIILRASLDNSEEMSVADLARFYGKYGFEVVDESEEDGYLMCKI